jgi:hypothetical protein
MESIKLNETNNIYGILSESVKELKQIYKNVFRTLKLTRIKIRMAGPKFSTGVLYQVWMKSV